MKKLTALAFAALTTISFGTGCAVGTDDGNIDSDEQEIVGTTGMPAIIQLPSASDLEGRPAVLVELPGALEFEGTPAVVIDMPGSLAKKGHEFAVIDLPEWTASKEQGPSDLIFEHDGEMVSWRPAVIVDLPEGETFQGYPTVVYVGLGASGDSYVELPDDIIEMPDEEFAGHPVEIVELPEFLGLESGSHPSSYRDLDSVDDADTFEGHPEEVVEL